MENNIPKFTCNPLKTCKLRTAGLSSKKAATFGMVRKTADGKPRAHQGIDLASDAGYRCYAVEDGTISKVENAYSGYGQIVILKLDCPAKPLIHGKFVMYAHLSQVRVRQGQSVKAGDVVGLTGDSGNAKGMDTIAEGGHLHFELRTGINLGLGLAGRLDPQPYISMQ